MVAVEILEYSPTSPFCVVRFSLGSSGGGAASPEQDVHEVVVSFMSRAIQAKAIYELWGSGSNYESLHADVRARSQHLWSRYQNDVSFKFGIDSYFGKRSAGEQREIINQFAYFGFQGKVDMKHPDQEWCIMEEWGSPLHLSSNGLGENRNNDGHSQPSSEVGSQSPANTTSKQPRRIFLGRKITYSRRYLVEKHDLKKRPYISTTSMDAELALITATLALASPGKLFLDPFCGTGGFMVAAAELGAVVLGSDIDGRSFRGKGEGVEKGVGRNMKLYGIDALFGDCLTSDLTNTPLRRNRVRWLDGIIADIPYGVREGLKVLGRKQLVKEGAEEGSLVVKQPHKIGGVLAHTLPGYIAPKKPYSFSKLLEDILDFAARTLVDSGRLAFWMPTANENEEDEQESTIIPSHAILELKHECVQRFNKWSRRLLVYERVGGEFDVAAPEGDALKPEVNGNSADELNPFRRRYFQSFAKAPNR
ncbi:hypothetical protein DV737_g1352, partial [Chaetothyriales sp. CBS 132003]